MRVLTFDSRCDAFASAAGDYRRRVLYPDLVSTGARLISLAGPGATRAGVLDALASPQLSLFTGSGHGRSGAFFGDLFELVFNADPFDRCVPRTARGVVVHLLACKTARELGRAFVAGGTAAFVGYDSDFYYDEACPEIFFACDAVIDRALVAGLPVGAALAEARRAFAASIADLRRAGEPHAAAMLQFNLNHLCGPDRDPAFGDPKAVLG